MVRLPSVHACGHSPVLHTQDRHRNLGAGHRSRPWTQFEEGEFVPLSGTYCCDPGVALAVDFQAEMSQAVRLVHEDVQSRCSQSFHGAYRTL